MDAFHSLWTKPSGKINSEVYRMEDFEILTLILSAVTWRKYNGSIRMITDSVGLDYIFNNNLEGLYDLGVTKELDCIKGIDSFLFWAAGKIFALKSIKSPCVMLDTDFIVWQDIRQYLKNDVIAAHEEGLYESVYPKIDVFKMDKEYIFSSKWDYSINPANTAFLYIPSQDFKNYYTGKSIEFMENCYNNKEFPVSSIVSMCFAEQRILPMCVAEKNLRIGYLLNKDKLNEQNLVTHIWGYKNILRKSKEETTRFCKKCVNRIKVDYPEYLYIIENSKELAVYL